MTDTESVRRRHLRPEQWQHRTFYEGHIMVDLNALVEEVEYLRGECDRSSLEAQVCRQERDAAVKAIEAERKASVHWIRRMADWVEDGEHRKEKQP